MKVISCDEKVVKVKVVVILYSIYIYADRCIMYNEVFKVLYIHIYKNECDI